MLKCIFHFTYYISHIHLVEFEVLKKLKLKTETLNTYLKNRNDQNLQQND